MKVIGLSVDSIESHSRRADDIEATQGNRPHYPIIGDSDRSIATQYGMIHPKASDTATVCSVFIIDPAKTIRTVLTYPASTGRNFDETLRIVDSLQLTDTHKVATPVNWKNGEDVIIIPSVSNEEARKLFPGGWKEHRTYLRTVKQPG